MAMAADPVPLDMDTLSPMSTVSSYHRLGAEPLSRRSSASSAPSVALRPSLTRRSSLEEDYFYREVFTAERSPNEPPPSYETTIKKIRRRERAAAAAAAASDRKMADRKAPDVTRDSKSSSSKGKGKAIVMDSHASQIQSYEPSEDVLPPYSCDIHIEGVFQKKMEIQNTTKRAEDRRWNTEYIVLHGTALEVYECRKDRSWAGRTAKTGPGVSPDRPPWMRKAALEKRYSLLYADVGIAADYVKRRYVIRIRAETDQFLISCVELETFVQWLDALFAAISIAAPIDERDFPRDQSIPRVQRIRWFGGRAREEQGTVEGPGPEDGRAGALEQGEQGERVNNESLSRTVSPVRVRSQPVQPVQPESSRAAEEAAAAAAAAILAEEVSPAALSSSLASSSSSSSPSAVTVAGPSTHTHTTLQHVSAQQLAAARAMQTPQVAPSVKSGKSSLRVRQGARFSLRSIASRLAHKNQQKATASKNSKRTGSGSGTGSGSNNGNNNNNSSNVGPAQAVAGIGGRSGISSATNHAFVDAATGKWQPSHRWTKTHDMVYAKLCYATLLFRSPRKSNYIIVRGKRWLVDWKTGNMARVSPPWYGEIECQPGPWQIMRTENARI